MEKHFELPVLVVNFDFRVHSIFVNLIGEQVGEVILQKGANRQFKSLILPLFEPVTLLNAHTPIRL